MSKRTSEASKAVRAAWIKEQKLVSEGKGTRDWTPEQQKDILELGKAYYHSDDPNDVNDGKAFEGHHMKSAETYPEYQGDTDNIQFLSRSEHQEAHGGDYRNPTNGYFDTVKKFTLDFGDNKYEPCKILELTNPVVRASAAVQVVSEKAETSPKDSNKKSLGGEQERNTPPKKAGTAAASTIKLSSKANINIGEKIMDFVKAIKYLGKRHSVLTVVLKFVGVVAVTEGIEKAITNSGKGSGSGSGLSSSDDYFSSSSDKYTSSSSTDDYCDSSLSKDYPEEHSSPKEHTVSAHGQHYHTKDGVIWKEKESYPRGGKHDDS